MKKLTKNIHVEMQPIPMNLQRYKDIGDWVIDDGKEQVTFNCFVGDMENTDYNFLVLIHELIEAYLCYRRGITDEEVTRWDKEHLDSDEAGALKGAPYHKEHTFATKVEAMLSDELGVVWPKYEDIIEKTLKKWKA